MNFFEHQANARRQTGRLLIFFITAVVLTVLAVDIGLYALGFMMVGGVHGNWLWHDWSAQAFVGTFLVIFGGSLVEYLHLRGGGQSVAELVGGRRIDFATTHFQERQLINVVEEMSIASGVPSPMLYVLERESGINAFVAGLSLHDSVMVVTQGALDTFTREELQAVVGHEFSHILNGDMRLNVRLMALLAGILTLGQIGSFIMRATGTFRSRNKNERSGLPHLFVVGLLLWMIGSIGLLFGRLIKAAISRQREFLADASSVQFTRNPDGLAGALIKIKNHSEQSWLNNLRAESMSHMCFGEALHFSQLLATHPPLVDRITALGRQYLVKDRAYQREQRLKETAAQQLPADTPASVSAGSARPDLPLIPFTTSSTLSPSSTATQSVPAVSAGAKPDIMVAQMAAPAVLARAGTVNPEQLASAQEIHRRLPPRVMQALQTSAGAQVLLYALMAIQAAASQQQVVQFFTEQEPSMLGQVQELLRALDGLDSAFALPLTELALPRLQVLPERQQRQFLARLQALAWLGGGLSTFEFALLILLRKQLQVLPKARAVRLDQCLPNIARMIVLLLQTGGMVGANLERSYDRLMRTIYPTIPPMPVIGAKRFQDFSVDLHLIAGLSLTARHQVLELAATAVLADGKIVQQEYELLRVVAALLDCPMPLLQL